MNDEDRSHPMTDGGAAVAPSVGAVLAMKLAAASHDGVLAIDASGRIAWANPTAARIAGVASPESLTGTPASDLLADPAQGARLATELRLHGEVHADDLLLLHRNGAATCRHVKATIVRVGREGEAPVYAALLSDVTDFVEAEQALQKSVNRYRTLARHFPNGAVHLFDRDYRYVLSDGVLHASFALDPERIIGRRITEVLPPEACELVIGGLRRAFAGEDVRYTVEWAELAIEIFMVPVRDETGQVVNVIAMSQDVTASRREAARLRHYQAVIAQVEQVASIGVWRYSFGDAPDFWSDNLFRIFGLEVGSLVPSFQEFLELIHPADRERIRDTVQTVIETDAPTIAYRCRIVRPDGDVRVIDLRGAKLEGGRDGPGRRVTGIVMDVTEMARSEEARRQAEAELARQQAVRIRADRLRSLGEMCSAIAHEVNQPLVGVRGLAEHLVLAQRRGRAPTAAQSEGMLQTIIDQVDRIDRIMQHIRDFAGGADKTAGAAVDVNAAVRAAADLVAAQFRGQSLEIQMDLEPALPTVNANRYAIEDILMNLLLNARDASLEAREATGHDDVARGIVVRTHASAANPPRIRLQVEDEGAGIPPELLDRVFEPFFTTKGPQEGSGLGLAIVRSIIGDLGGTVELKSRLGQGTIVTISLPAGEPCVGDQRWLFDDC